MIQFFSMFFPAFFGLFILNVLLKKKLSIQNIFIIYGFLTFLVNVIMFFILGFFERYRGKILDNNFFYNSFSLKYILLATIIILFFIFIYFLFFNQLVFSIDKTEYIVKKTSTKKLYIFLKYITGTMLYFFSGILFFGSKWLIDTFGLLKPEELIFHMKVPLVGANNDAVWSFIKGPIFYSLLMVLFIFVLITNILKDKQLQLKVRDKDKSEKKYTIYPFIFLKKHFIFIALILILIAGIVGIKRLGYKDIYNYIFTNSKFIKEEYVNPEKVDLTFPNKKRNLVYIYMESLESSYFSKELGGLETQNLMPELSQLSQQKENVQFSNSDKIGGSTQVPGTGWTIAGMFSQTAGLPLKLPITDNGYGHYTSFMPGVTAMGDILAKEGYNQEAMMGSVAAFGGRQNYFEQHGNYKVFDLQTAKDKKLIPDDYNEWWGFEDQKLYQYAKDEITNLAKKEKPFNFTMLTADTHAPDGYKCSLCGDKYPDQYSNVIACASKQVSEFVQWLMEQDYYENTTIVLVGDHLSMSKSHFSDSLERERHPFNLFINPSDNGTSTAKNRQFTSFDFFPTTLSSLGVKIKGNQLGLGTDLFSNKKTLLELKGYDELNKELSNKSDFYNKKFIYDRPRQGQK